MRIPELQLHGWHALTGSAASAAPSRALRRAAQVKYTLQALQHKSDFLPNEAADPEISLTLPCQLVCALVTALGKQALAVLQAGNAQSYVAEVGSSPPRLSMFGWHRGAAHRSSAHHWW